MAATARPYHRAMGAGTEDAARVYGLAPWARRRGRVVQGTLVVGALVIGGAIMAMLSGTESFGIGVALAIVTLAIGFGMAWYIGRVAPRVRLAIGPDGVRYDAGTHAIAAAWSDVAAVDLVIRGSDTGPALVLHGDRAVSGGGMLGAAGIGQAIGGTGLFAPSLKSTIPLNAFLQGGLAGSPIESDLRRYIPELVDGYLARYPDRRGR
jgi:hypothetical protein